MSESNKAVVRRYAEEILNKRNLALYEKLFTADSVLHGPSLPELRGGKARKEFFQSILAAFPDFHLTVDELIAEGDKAVLRWTETGTHRGEWWGAAPTGKKFSWSGTTIFQVSGGMITDEFIQWDALGFMQQLGVVPAIQSIQRAGHA